MKRMSGFVLICATQFIVTVSSAETVYENTDASGAVEFSDQPSAGSQAIEVTPNVVDVTPPPAIDMPAAPAVTPAPAGTSETIEVYRHVIGAEGAVTEEEAIRRQRLMEREEAERRNKVLHQTDEDIRGDEGVHQSEAERGGEAVHYKAR